MTLRTLSSVARAARNQDLELVPTTLPEVLFQCPLCKADGKHQLCRVEMIDGNPSVTCNGCSSWGDDPFDILGVLGYDPDTTSEFEIQLRVFDLLWALHRAAQ